MREKEEIDLRKDPPPDLVIEVDITSPSVKKLPIFWDIGVIEVWQYSKNSLAIMQRTESGYAESLVSSVLPGVSNSHLNNFIQRVTS